jgi:hypothetical protein
VLDIVDEPLHGGGQPRLLLLFDRSNRVNGPVPAQTLQAQLLAHLLQIHGCDVSFVGQHQHDRVFHVGVAHYPVQLFGGEVQPFAVGTVDDVYQGSRVLEVVRPQTAKFLLPPHVPDHEVDCLEVQLFDVEPDGGDREQHFPQFQGVENGGLARPVEPQHHHFALSLGRSLGK